MMIRVILTVSLAGEEADTESGVEKEQTGDNDTEEEETPVRRSSRRRILAASSEEEDGEGEEEEEEDEEQEQRRPRSKGAPGDQHLNGSLNWRT